MFLFFKGDPTSKCFSFVIIWIFFVYRFLKILTIYWIFFRSGTLLETRELVSLIKTRNYFGLIYSITIPSMLFIILHNDGYIVDILKNKSRLVINVFSKQQKKQPPEVFCEKRFSQQFRKFLRKMHVSNSKFAGATLLKRDSNKGVFLWILRNF